MNHDCKCLFPWNRCSETHSFTLSFFVCGSISTMFGNKDLQDLHFLLFWAEDFKTKWWDWGIRDICSELAPTQWKTVQWVVFFLTSKSTSSMFGRAFSGGVDWCTPQEFSFVLRGPLRVRVFAKSLRIKVLWYIYIYIIVGLEEGILYLSSCRIPESHII